MKARAVVATVTALGASLGCIAAPTVELRNATETAVVVKADDGVERPVAKSQSTRFEYSRHLQITISGRPRRYDMPVWPIAGHRQSPYFEPIGMLGTLLVLKLESDGTLRAMPPEGGRTKDDRRLEVQPPEFPVRPTTPLAMLSTR